MNSTSHKLIDYSGKIEFSVKAKKANIIITGDFCPILRLEPYLLDGNLSAVFSDTLEVFQNSNLNIINLEAVLCGDVTPIQKVGPNLKVNPNIAKQLKNIPVHVACLSNNHILDYHEAGLTQTIQALDKENIKYVGAGSTKIDAETPLFIEVNGVKLCFVNFVVAGAPISFETANTSMLEPRKNCIAIKKAKAEGTIVIPIIHTGKEQVLLPAPGLRDTCKDFIDAGASAVICHHPHVPQGIEIYENKPILYSLGNLLFDWDTPEPETDSSFFVELGLDETNIVDLKVHPFAKISEDGCIGLLKGSDRDQYIDLLNKISEPFTDSQKYEKLWKEQCRILYKKKYLYKLKRAENLDSDQDSKARMAASTFHNFFAHQTHVDNLSEIMNMIIKKDMTLDQEANEWLTSLMTTLENFSITKKGKKS